MSCDGVKNPVIYPSIWIGDYSSKADFDINLENINAASVVYDWMDDRILFSRHPFDYNAYCAVCDCVQLMNVRWDGLSNGSAFPAWTETVVCHHCGLNSRMRALYYYVKTRINRSLVRKAYIAEAITGSYNYLSCLLPELVGTEYIDKNLKPGEFALVPYCEKPIQHEDLTSLSFADGKFDLVITQDVFEHISNYQKSFKEIARVLSSNGSLIFTIPFFSDLSTTRVRAKVTNTGIEHIMPPEIHGNPVSQAGSLCYQNFGWDILEDLRNSGFSEAFASMYWGPWQGHMGRPFFVFCATKYQSRLYASL
jgi:SAM-dependent methyltransferase